MNVILQTFGEMGKGEIVISGKNGEIGGGDDNNELDFELKTRGDLRYNSTVAFTNLTYHFGGIFTHPVVYFYPGSVFKMDNGATRYQITCSFTVRMTLLSVVMA